MIFFCTANAFAGGTFRFRIAEDRGTLDWGYGEVNQDVVLQLMEGLTRIDAAGNVVSAAAKSWKKKGNNYEFNLEPAAKWSDGRKVCAQDFVDAWERVRSPALASPFSFLLRDVKSVHAEGCQKLRVELTKDIGFFAEVVSHWVLFPIRKDLIDAHPKDWTKPANLIVNGPYRLKEWARDSKYVLEKNPSYHAVSSGPASIEALVAADDATALLLFESGKLDWIRDLPFLEKQALSKRSEYIASPTLVEYHIGFKFGTGATLSRDQRCALARSIDIQKISEILKGGEIAAASLSLKNASRKKPNFDASKAKALWNKSPAPAGLVFHFYSKDIHVPLAEWIQEQWRTNLGVDVQLQKHEGKTYWSMLRSNPPALFLSGTTGSTIHPYSMLSEFMSGNAANWGHYASKEYDADVEEISKVERAPESSKKFLEAEELLLEKDCAIAPLYFRRTASLVSKHWKGFAMNPLARVDLRSLTFAE